jgi:hypothetical protein
MEPSVLPPPMISANFLKSGFLLPVSTCYASTASSNLLSSSCVQAFGIGFFSLFSYFTMEFS